MRKLLLLPLLLFAACGSTRTSLIGEPKAHVLADVDISDITSERDLEFGRSSVEMYSNFGEFIEDKLAMGAEVSPEFGDWSDGLKGRAFVSFTTVSERTPEARAGDGRSTATVWYFWDDRDHLLAILREPWGS